MHSNLPENLLESFSRFVGERAGLDFPRPRWADLERALTSAAGEFGFADVAECARSLLGPAARKEQVESLLARLTVGETYFFREPKAFDAFETIVLPALARAKESTGKQIGRAHV